MRDSENEMEIIITYELEIAVLEVGIVVLRRDFIEIVRFLVINSLPLANNSVERKTDFWNFDDANFTTTMLLLFILYEFAI